VLSGQANTLPKSGTSAVEMIRPNQSCARHRGQGTYPGHADDESNHRQRPGPLREQLDRVTGKMKLVRCLAALRPGPINSTTVSAKVSLRAIARR
jgi:transposase